MKIGDWTKEEVSSRVPNHTSVFANFASTCGQLQHGLYTSLNVLN